MLKRIAAEQARLDMYVHGFEGGWLSHPFWRGRFVINSAEKLHKVREGGTALVIDTDRGADIAAPDQGGDAAPLVRRTAVQPAPVIRASAARPKAALRRVTPPAAFGRADRTRAVALAKRSTAVVRALFDDCRLGRAVATHQILAAVADIADTLEQNSAAFASVTRLKTKDDATYTHCVAVCALMVNLARETGADPATVQELGIAGLLHDIGKVSIDAAILQKVEALTEAERAEISRHPELGHAILSAESGLPAVALDICLHHHERLDGSGYPFGLQGDAISKSARMAAICDVYDAMTSDRPYKKGTTPTAAIAEMAASDQYDPALLFRFMRSIGVFPTGKLVRLRSNRLAAILPAAGVDRRPVARAFYATVDTCFIDYDDIVIGPGLNDDQAISDEQPEDWFADGWDVMSRRIMAGSALSPSG